MLTYTGQLPPAPLAVIQPSLAGEYYFSLRVTDAQGRADVSEIYAVASDSRWQIPDPRRG